MRFSTASSVVELFRRETVTTNTWVGTGYIWFDIHGFGDVQMKMSVSLNLHIFFRSVWKFLGFVQNQFFILRVIENLIRNKLYEFSGVQKSLNWRLTKLKL